MKTDKNVEIVWSPQPKQKIFLSRCEFEVLYGGAAGGGKSDSILIDALRQIKHKSYRAIIFRKTYPQLTELIDRALELYKIICPAVKFNDSKHVFSFPSGSKVYFASMQHTKDKTNYQGKQFQFIGIDELTHFLEEEYMYLLSRCRARAAGLRCYMRGTANPGGVGHGFVKSRFIDQGAFKTVNEFYVYKKKIMIRDRIFIPASLFDNSKLLENDPNYLANLMMLPEKEKNALLEGSWEEYAGQYYPEFRSNTHVIVPFEIPSNWVKFRSLDYGLDMTACYWWAVDTKGYCYIYRELYQSNLSLSQSAKKIVELTNKDEEIAYTVCSPDLWNRRQESGESGQEIMIKSGLRNLIKANDSRVQGWRTLREYLMFYDSGIENKPRINIFQNCVNLIRCFPLLQHDEKNVEDVANTPHEITHAPESIRYGIMSRPKLSVITKKVIPQWESEKPKVNNFTGGEPTSSWINY
jgi:hypothetical protein